MTYKPNQAINLLFLVDWDGDGNYKGALANISNYVMSARWNVGFRDANRLVADEMRLEITLDNDKRYFSPEYTQSPLYGLYPMTKRVKVTARFEGAEYTLWHGWIESIQPQPMRNGERRARLMATGPRAFIQRTKVYLPLLENVTVDTALTRILAAVSVPPQGNHAALDISGHNALNSNAYLVDTGLTSSLEPGIETFSYIGDTWEDGVDAVSAIAQLVSAERGRLFVARDGTVTFWNKYHLAADTATDWVLMNNWQALAYEFGADIYNVVTATYSPRSISSGDELLWRLDEPIVIEPTKSRTVRATFSEQGSDSRVSGRGVQRPEAASGRLVMDASLVMVRFEASASGAEMEFTNGSTTTDATISAVEVWGRKLTAYNSVTVTESDPVSVYRYGAQELKIDMKLADDDVLVRSTAQYELARRKDARGVCKSVTMTANSSADVRRLLSGTVGTRIEIYDEQTAHGADYFVIGEEHEWNDALSVWQVKWQLEAAANAAYARLDDAKNAKLDSTAVLL